MERHPTSRAGQGLARAGAFLVTATLLSNPVLAERRYSDWGPAVNLGCGTINSPANDFGPGLPKDGGSLYFSSNRASPDAIGGVDIYVAQRASTTEPWGLPRNLGRTVNSPALDAIPSFSRDGHWMFFNSSRQAGGFGDVDLWASYREDIHDDFAWQTPGNLGNGVNTAGFEAGASYLENEDGGAPLLFFGRGGSQDTQGSTTDIWVSELFGDGTFGNARPVAELNAPQPYGDQRPSIRFDGLEMFFFSNRPGSTPNPSTGAPTGDIWVATRKSVNGPWDVPVKLMNHGEPVNTAFQDLNPHISADGLTLYFTSDRPAGPGCGAFDLYMTTRTKLKGSEP